MRRSQFAAFALGCIALQMLCAQGPGPQRPLGPWSNTSLTPDQRADLVIAAMTLDEKIQMVHGAGLQGLGETDPAIVRSNGGGGFVPGIARLGIPDINMNDTSMGSGGGAKRGRYSTALPCTLALASSWDAALAREFGAVVGRELADQGYNVSLGGGVNITREARDGRGFEYEGEDPILAGTMGAGLITGIQSQGVIGDIKHYAVNDEETGRYFANSIIGKRAMRETDLLAFEIGVKLANPGMVMCSYNFVNGEHACENDYLLNQVLKKDWGFPGWVVSDWFATHSTTKAVLNGLDQEQPTFQFLGAALKKAIEAGEVPMARLNDMVHRIIRTEFASGIVDHPQPTAVPDIFHGFDVAQKTEEQSAVLLRNEHEQLPLNAAALRSIAVIGSHADVGVLSGGGSANVDPPGGNAVPDQSDPNDIAAMFTRVVWDPSSPLKAIAGHARGAIVAFNQGDDPEAAAEFARKSDVAIIFVHQHTHEGNDVPTLALPGNQDALVSAVAAANPHTVVVLETGTPVMMPWANRVNAILEAWYPGIRGGEAIANLLFGDAGPSGKLPVTFARSDADLPHPQLPAPPGPTPSPLEGVMEAKPPYDIHYSEGLKVGYKWFDAEGKGPLYPFGFGLHYTTFAYSDLTVAAGKERAVRFTVRNTGKRAGAEIAEVYLSFPESAGEPPKRLVAWKKVALGPGESKAVDLTLNPMYCSVFDEATNGWKLVPGEYQVMAGSSSRDLPLKARMRF